MRKPNKRIAVIAAIALLLIAAGTWYFVERNDELKKVEAGRMTANALFSDDTHMSLAYFKSEDATATAKVFDDAKAAIGKVKNTDKREALLDDVKKAEGFWVNQLKAHRLITALMCGGVAGIPRENITAEELEVARKGLEKVTNLRTKAELAERLAIVENEICTLYCAKLCRFSRSPPRGFSCW